MGLEQYDEEVVEKAVWLQEHIWDQGIDAAHFMRSAKRDAVVRAPGTVRDHITSSLSRL